MRWGWFWLAIVVAVALGIVGAVAHGLLYILAIGVAVFVADLVFLGVLLRRRWQRPAR